MRKEDPKSLDPLELEEFYEEIESREGFCKGALGGIPEHTHR